MNDEQPQKRAGEAAEPGGFPVGDARALLARARERHRAGAIAAAERLYREVIARWPETAQAHRLLGILLAESGRSDAAIGELAEAARLAPGNAHYLNDLGSACLAANRLAEAGEAYRRALELSPGLADTHFSLGNLFRRQGKLGDAIAAYRRAAALSPELVHVHINLGVTLQEASVFDEAVAALRRAAALDSRSFAAHFNLGLVLAAQRRPREAVAAYRAAVAIDAQSAPAQLNLGTALQEAENLAEAKESFARAAALDPNLAQAYVNLGAVLYEEGDFAAALAAIRRGLEIEPGKALTYVNLAQTLEALGEPAAADAAFRRALELDPALTTAKAHWSIALQQAANWDEAQALLDYPRLLKTRRLGEVAGWPTVAAFNAELARYVYGHPTLMRDPPAKATQNGSQTMEVLNSAAPPIAALQRFIEESVRGYFETALDAARNPLAPSPPRAWHLHGWAVVLRAGGYQTAHFHPEAVVSGVYYVQIPKVVKAGLMGEAGFIKFGPPAFGTPGAEAPGAKAGDTPLSVALCPEEGMIVLFPSYFWHSTVPFDGGEERICIAFDVVDDSEAVRIA